MPINVLFLCTGNSARSILAEAIANGRYGDALRAASAGSRPKDRPHPLALDTLRAHGLETGDLCSKRIEGLEDERFDVVITLCDSAAREACPILPGAPGTVHWGLPDPPAAPDPRAVFESVYATLDGALARLAESVEGDAVERAKAVWEEAA